MVLPSKSWRKNGMNILCSTSVWLEASTWKKEQLEHYLLFILKTNEEKFGITCDSPAPNIRMLNLIQTVYEKTGKQPVVLIDEYDAPLLDVVHEGTLLRHSAKCDEKLL